MTLFQRMLMALASVFLVNFCLGRFVWPCVVGLGLVLAAFCFDMVTVKYEPEEQIPEGEGVWAKDFAAMQARLERQTAEMEELKAKITAVSVVAGLQPQKRQ